MKLPTMTAWKTGSQPLSPQRSVGDEPTAAGVFGSGFQSLAQAHFCVSRPSCQLNAFSPQICVFHVDEPV